MYKKLICRSQFFKISHDCRCVIKKNCSRQYTADILLMLALTTNQSINEYDCQIADILFELALNSNQSIIHYFLLNWVETNKQLKSVFTRTPKMYRKCLATFSVYNICMLSCEIFCKLPNQENEPHICKNMSDMRMPQITEIADYLNLFI